MLTKLGVEKSLLRKEIFDRFTRGQVPGLRLVYTCDFKVRFCSLQANFVPMLVDRKRIIQLDVSTNLNKTFFAASLTFRENKLERLFRANSFSVIMILFHRVTMKCQSLVASKETASPSGESLQSILCESRS
jgi:hypothetical protein